MLTIPEGYKTALDVYDTQRCIEFIKSRFQANLRSALNLKRVSAPLFVRADTGLNDDLNGVERPVSFDVPATGAGEYQIVHSLAKWKRWALREYDFRPGNGLYTDMNAIRRDEPVLDNLHSVYVDQWDWEKVILKEERTEETLIETVKKIFHVIKHMQHEVWYKFPDAAAKLPKEIHFITTQELLDRYPDKTPKERENLICKELGCVFLMQIGDLLSNGEKHDGRAPDYDDYSTISSLGLPGLNGDIMIWDEVLGCAVEVSSMGVRVDKEALLRQLKLSGKEERKELYFHKRLLSGQLPLSIGGGIGQSRLCMLYLKKAHVGEIQASIWPQDMRDKCRSQGINLL